MRGPGVSGQIRNAINNLPVGLCFALPNGVPILVNRKMNAIVFELFGHAVNNVEMLSEELKKKAIWYNNEAFLIKSENEDRYWAFRRMILKKGEHSYIQLEARDETETSRAYLQISENNRMLEEQLHRKRSIMTNIVEINRKKEILSLKMRIHDDLGRCLIATERELDGDLDDESVRELKKQWSMTLDNFGRMTDDHTVSPIDEILKVADAIGCKLEFKGIRPNSRRVQKLYAGCIREAITNAVRHAGADTVYVLSTAQKGMYILIVTDNGSVRFEDRGQIVAGEGLKSLRGRLEQEGGSLVLETGLEGVVLKATIPADE